MIIIALGVFLFMGKVVKVRPIDIFSALMIIILEELGGRGHILTLDGVLPEKVKVGDNGNEDQDTHKSTTSILVVHGNHSFHCS